MKAKIKLCLDFICEISGRLCTDQGVVIYTFFGGGGILSVLKNAFPDVCMHYDLLLSACFYAETHKSTI